MAFLLAGLTGSLLGAAASVEAEPSGKHAAVVSAESVSLAAQQFRCNTGYQVPECLRQIAVLKSVLARYRPEELRPWTWVLVRSEHWKPLLRSRGMDADSPAFSYLEGRQTFLEEVLLTPRSARAGPNCCRSGVWGGASSSIGPSGTSWGTYVARNATSELPIAMRACSAKEGGHNATG
jgi:hypothetical protein